MFDHATLLTEVFGRWPSFHDAEVLWVRLDREGADGPTIDAQIYLFEPTAEVDAAGRYVLVKRTLVTLRFGGVSLEGMAWLNQQNVLEDLKVTELYPEDNEGRRWRVELVPSFGLGATLECKSAAVIDVRPSPNAA